MLYKRKMAFAFFCYVLFAGTVQAQAPSADVLKRVLEKRLQELLPTGFTKRTVSFTQVTPGTPNGGYYPFKVTAYVHDYGPGYPANKYYGQSCLGKMDGWKFDLRKDDFGEWIVQGRLTITGPEVTCVNNTAEGVAAIPLTAVPGQPYVRGAEAAFKTEKATPVTSLLYVGEYACYGTGGQLMVGLGFILQPNGRYTDLDKARGGTYVYNNKAATITFKGGFLSGQVGKNVKQTGFQLSNTVYAEPWR